MWRLREEQGSQTTKEATFLWLLPSFVIQSGSSSLQLTWNNNICLDSGMFSRTNHLGGISAGQFPQAAVSHRLAPQHLTPLSLLQFILLTADWANGLRRRYCKVKGGEKKKEYSHDCKITYGLFHSKMHPVLLTGL